MCIAADARGWTPFEMLNHLREMREQHGEGAARWELKYLVDLKDLRIDKSNREDEAMREAQRKGPS